eukprot:m.432095 g.432095  ORF g.432095 m.432095 type:complete len:77 (+) comp17388_c0_seq1:1581-1811(+)
MIGYSGGGATGSGSSTPSDVVRGGVSGGPSEDVRGPTGGGGSTRDDPVVAPADDSVLFEEADPGSRVASATPPGGV